jgi:hypothetical protein
MQSPRPAPDWEQARQRSDSPTPVNNSGFYSGKRPSVTGQKKVCFEVSPPAEAADYVRRKRPLISVLFGATFDQVLDLRVCPKERRAAAETPALSNDWAVSRMPVSAIEPLRVHLQTVRAIHRQALANGLGCAWLPHALERNYPNAASGWGWQYVFPAADVSTSALGNRAPTDAGQQRLPGRRTAQIDPGPIPPLQERAAIPILLVHRDP